MDPAFACVQARLDSFAAPKSKSRRTSSRSKKAAPKATQKAAWPLESPSPQDLAYAGFVWKPTSTSPDNVQCFNCNCQLDGWEETDVPAYEHLTHSPDCGFAVNVCIRLRSSDPGRTEEDPLSEPLVNARRQTFADIWPLDADAGFPSVDQMVAAGWYYDPSTDNPDGVTCPYCSLSLDAWDAGDDPLEEHGKRASDCLFFTLKEFYHPEPKAKATRGKRASTRSSTASTKVTKTKRTTKKKATKEDLSKPLPPTPDATMDDATAMTGAEMTAMSGIEIDTLPDAEIEVPPKAPRTRRGAKRASAMPADDSTMSAVEAPIKVPRTRKAPQRVSAVSNASTASRPRGRPKRVSTTSEASVSNTTTAKTTRGKKRTSEQLDVDNTLEQSPKRSKFLDIDSDMPESMLEGTQFMSPQPDTPETKAPHTMDNEIMVAENTTPPGSPGAQTPQASTPNPRTPEAQTPAGVFSEDRNSFWEPVDIDGFFERKADESANLLSQILVDAGLDKENFGATKDYAPEALIEAVKTRLTTPEKKMTIEEWVMYNAKRGEEKLRMECERQIAAFEAESKRALAALDDVPVIGL